MMPQDPPDPFEKLSMDYISPPNSLPLPDDMKIFGQNKPDNNEGHHLEELLVDRREFLKISAGTAATIAGAAYLLNGDATAEEPKNKDEHHLSPEVKALIEKHWHEQDAAYEKIAEVGFQAFYESLSDKDKAFFTKEHVEHAGKCSCCSDEGNREVKNDKGEKMELIRTPGSGILQALDLPDQNPFDPEFINDTAQEAVTNGIKVFTGHKGCGAAKGVLKAWLIKQGKKEEAEKLTPEKIDAFARKWAEAVTQRMKEIDDTTDVQCGFIENLSRPEEIHVARCLYLTDIDELDSSYKGLPQGFVERTGGKTDLKDVLEHTEILRGIAFDKAHAFGTKFSQKKQDQFVICCVAKTPERLNFLMADAQKKIDSLEPEVANMIRVDGILATAA